MLPQRRLVWFGEPVGLAGTAPFETEVRWRPSLAVGTRVTGPALLEQYDSVTLIPPRWEAEVDRDFNLRVRVRES